MTNNEAKVLVNSSSKKYKLQKTNFKYSLISLGVGVGLTSFIDYNLFLLGSMAHMSEQNFKNMIIPISIIVGVITVPVSFFMLKKNNIDKCQNKIKSINNKKI